MPRKLIKQYLPNPDSIKKNRYLKIFGKVIHDPQLWHLTRYSVSNAFFVGLFCAFIPVPFQMLIAAAGAIIFRANIAISIALVWITNPITMPFLFGLCYFVGAWALASPTSQVTFELSWDWLVNNLNEIWEPFLLGCLICGVLTSLIGYGIVRLFWRLHIVSAWQKRNEARRN